MLVLTRGIGEGILFNDGQVKITVVRIKGMSVRLSVDCAREKKVDRLDIDGNVVKRKTPLLLDGKD